MKLSSMDQIHRIRKGIEIALAVIFGSVFIFGLMALVVFLDDLARPLR